MTGDDAPRDGPADDPRDARDERRPGRPADRPPADRVDDLAEELAAVRGDLEALETRVDERTVHRDDFAAELKRYVRARVRRGHARDWGPYLVLLYGTAMTLGAFFYLGGVWAILAMVVVWLSTLGLYVVMLFVGAFVGAGRKVAGLRDVAGRFR